MPGNAGIEANARQLVQAQTPIGKPDSRPVSPSATHGRRAVRRSRVLLEPAAPRACAHNKLFRRPRSFRSVRSELTQVGRALASLASLARDCASRWGFTTAKAASVALWDAPAIDNLEARWAACFRPAPRRRRGRRRRLESHNASGCRGLNARNQGLRLAEGNRRVAHRFSLGEGLVGTVVRFRRCGRPSSIIRISNSPPCEYESPGRHLRRAYRRDAGRGAARPGIGER